MGSKSDESKMLKAKETLDEFGVESEWRVLSAHRNPDQVVELVSTARDNGFVAFICGAGMAAHLAGVVACLLYTSPSPRDQRGSRMPSSA